MEVKLTTLCIYYALFTCSRAGGMYDIYAKNTLYTLFLPMGKGRIFSLFLSEPKRHEFDTYNFVVI